MFAFTTTATCDAEGNILSEEALADYLAECEENETEPELTEKTIFTLQNILDVSKYTTVLINSAWLALIATVICLVIAYPLAYMISRMFYTRQKLALMLVMLPMWMHFLLRTYAWMTLLEKNGLINKLFGLIGLGPFNMINTQGAVVLGMIYNYLPFMILPLYSVMTKIDNRTVEAAQDLGANSFRSFPVLSCRSRCRRRFGHHDGLRAVSFDVHHLGECSEAERSTLIGDLIDLQFLGNAYNPNLGAAISLVLMVFIFLCMSITNQLDNEEMDGVLL